MLWKIQPIRTQGRYDMIFNGITFNLSIILPHLCQIDHFGQSINFSVAWCKIVMQQSLMVIHGISCLPLVFSWHPCLKSCVYIDNLWDIPVYLRLENVG